MLRPIAHVTSSPFAARSIVAFHFISPLTFILLRLRHRLFIYHAIVYLPPPDTYAFARLLDCRCAVIAVARKDAAYARPSMRAARNRRV